MMILIMVLMSAVVLILMVQVLLSKKETSKGESLSPLESGFESMINSMSLSAPFFFLAVLFVLFDMELILFFPGVLSFMSGGEVYFIWIVINMIVFVTLVIEWTFCGLKWQV